MRLPIVLTTCLASTLLAGCEPTCAQMCNKLERCGLAGEVDNRECEESCNRELGDARDLKDKDVLKAFNAHRRCIGNASCDDLDAGECYTEGDAFPWSRG